MILEEECGREIADFFKRLEAEIHRIMDEYWESELGLFHLNKVSDIIQDSRQEYYDILFKYCQIQYLKGREATERRFYRQLEMVSIKADVSITRLEDLFQPDPTIRYNLNNKVFQASTHTMDRVDTRVMENISQSYNDGVGIDEAKRRLTVEYNGLKSWEAQRIARTEINSAQNDGAFDVYGELGVEYQQWWTAQDERVRQSPQADHRIMHGKIVKVGTAFSNGLLYPGDRQGKISQWINCRCTTLPFIMPLGKMAPVGMSEFTEADLIDIPDFEMPTIEDLMNGIVQVPNANQEEYRRLANELIENQIKAGTISDYKKAAEFERKMFDLIEKFENENLDWEDYVDYEYVSKEIYRLQRKIDETDSLYYKGMYEEAQDSLKNLLARKGKRYEDYLTETSRKAVAKEIDLEFYRDRYTDQFGRYMRDDVRKRMEDIEKMYPKEAKKIARELVPSNTSKLTEEERRRLRSFRQRSKLGIRLDSDDLDEYNRLKSKVHKEMIIERDVSYNLQARYPEYVNIQSDRFNVLRVKGYNCEIWVSTDSEMTATEILDELDKIPRKLLNQNHNRIVLSSDENVFNMNKGHFVAGVTKRSDNEIVIFHTKRSLKKRLGTIAHELGHAWDNNLSKITNRGGAYYKVAEEEGGFVTSYARKGYEKFRTYYSEDLAEAMELYVTEPKKLKRNFPKRYEFIKNMFEDDSFILGLLPY